MKELIKKIGLGALVLLCSTLFFSCQNEDNPNEEETGTTQTFKCKINGVPFAATFITTEGTSGIIIAEGLKASNGTSYQDGSVRISLSFGTNQAGALGLGAHSVLGRFETANQPNNQNKAVFDELLINNLIGYVKPGEGTVNVEKYYESTYWQGAKGTFNNIKIQTFTAAPEYKMDSVVLTDGEFDFKFTY